MKKFLIVMMMGVTFPYTGWAGILPHDMATIEALIDQHKRCMSAEDQSNQQLAANATIKAMVKDVAKKYDDVKSTLDKKSGDALAYLSLAAEMSRCVTNTVKLTKERYARASPLFLSRVDFTSSYFLATSFTIAVIVALAANCWLL